MQIQPEVAGARRESQTWKQMKLRAVQDVLVKSRIIRVEVDQVMMLGHTATAKKASKFEDSDSRMTRPRAVSELPQRSAPRLKVAAGSDASGAAPRRPVGVRGTAPRSPLHEKKPVGGGGAAAAGAGSRVAELEAKLDRAHAQLTEMREQLAAAEKARKDARAALAEAKKRFGAKKRGDVAAPVVEGGDRNKVLVAAAEAADVEEHSANDEKCPMNSLATDVLDAFVPSEQREKNEEAKNTIYDGELGNSMANSDGILKGSQEEADQMREKLMAKVMDVEELRSKLKAKDKEVDEMRAKLMNKDMDLYELRAKLMVRDTDVDELRETLTAKDTELDELRGNLASNDTEINKLKSNLMAKDADISALEADNADLTKAAAEAGDTVKSAMARARETEHALRESAAREARVAEKLRASEKAREELEAEAQRFRVQREQWRKAAEEAAYVIGGVERDDAGGAPPPGPMGTPRADRRCQSSAASGLWTAKGGEEDGAGGKRKSGAAMRVFSDLWKKKAQK